MYGPATLLQRRLPPDVVHCNLSPQQYVSVRCRLCQAEFSLEGDSRDTASTNSAQKSYDSRIWNGYVPKKSRNSGNVCQKRPQSSGVDPPVDSSRACLHTTFIVLSLHRMTARVTFCCMSASHPLPPGVRAFDVGHLSKKGGHKNCTPPKASTGGSVSWRQTPKVEAPRPWMVPHEARGCDHVRKFWVGRVRECERPPRRTAPSRRTPPHRQGWGRHVVWPTVQGQGSRRESPRLA